MIFMFGVQVIPFHLEKLEKFIGGKKQEGRRSRMRIVTSKGTTRKERHCSILKRLSIYPLFFQVLLLRTIAFNYRKMYCESMK